MKSFWYFTILVVSVTTCCLPVSAGPSIIISEVMFNPKNVSDTLGEWIELFNPLDTAVSLSGYSLGDLSGQRFGFDQGTTLEAGETLIVARSAIALQQLETTVLPWYFNFALNNGGDVITLQDNNGDLLDTVAWGGKLPGWDLSALEGETLQRLHLIDGAAGWSAGQLPTPGSSSITGVVPEPGTLLLLGMGLGMLRLLRKKFRD